MNYEHYEQIKIFSAVNLGPKLAKPKASCNRNIWCVLLLIVACYDTDNILKI